MAHICLSKELQVQKVKEWYEDVFYRIVCKKCGLSTPLFETENKAIVSALSGQITISVDDYPIEIIESRQLFRS